MIANKLFVSLHALRAKAEALYNSRDGAKDRPSWDSLPESTRIHWMRMSRNVEIGRQRKLMP